MHEAHRKALGGAALFAWVLLMAVSITANMKFAYSLAHSEKEGLILGAGALAADLLKAGAPVAFIWFVAQRRRWPAFAAFIIGIITMTFSIVSATGFVAGERMSYFDRMTAESRAAATSKAEIERLEKRRDFVPEHRPLIVVEADIAAAKGDRLWGWSEGCTKISGRDSDAFCKRYRTLIVEEASAKAGLVFESQLRDERVAAGTHKNLTGDYHVTAISRLTGFDPTMVLVALIALTVLLIEIGAGMGLTVSLALLAPETALGRALRTVAPREGAPVVPFVAMPASPARSVAVAVGEPTSAAPAARPPMRRTGLKPPKPARPAIAAA